MELSQSLVELFYPLVEMTHFDKEGLIKEIFNSFSALKEDQACDLKNARQLSPFLETLAIGRSVRCLIYPHAEGYVRLRFDLTHFRNLQEQLNALVSTPQSQPANNWNESIDAFISQFVREHKSNVQALSNKQKRELIAGLQQKGLLDFKESSAYLASKLQISRATVYNYLKTAADFKKVHIHQVDAFTSERFGGNPAGVVLDADGLDEATMRKITRELNLSETAFVFPSAKADFRLRFFTPTGHELGFCGHSTVGTLFTIAKERRFGIERAGSYTFNVETPLGILQMMASVDEAEEIKVAYETPTIRLEKSALTHEQVAKAAGFDLETIDLSIPVMFEATNRDLFIMASSLEDLKKMECDPKAFAQFSKQHDIVVLCVVAREALDAKNQFHMRCFAPLVGIPEDPFTGSVLGGLTAYVDTFGLLPKGHHQFSVEQGHFIDRPGVVDVEYSKKRGNYQAKVYAQAVHCFSTEINL